MSAAKPTALQREVLLRMKRDGLVLRRQGEQRSYSLMWPDRKTYAGFHLASDQVSALMVRYLDAYDDQGEKLPRASALGSRKLEFRIKPDVVLP